MSTLLYIVVNEDWWVDIYFYNFDIHKQTNLKYITYVMLKKDEIDVNNKKKIAS